MIILFWKLKILLKGRLLSRVGFRKIWCLLLRLRRVRRRRRRRVKRWLNKRRKRNTNNYVKDIRTCLKHLKKKQKSNKNGIRKYNKEEKLGTLLMHQKEDGLVIELFNMISFNVKIVMFCQFVVQDTNVLYVQMLIFVELVSIQQNMIKLILFLKLEKN